MRTLHILLVSVCVLAACQTTTDPRPPAVPPASQDTPAQARARVAITECGRQYGAQGEYGDPVFEETLDQGLKAARADMDTFMQCVVNKR